MEDKSKSENRVRLELFRSIGSRKDIRVFRNNVGMAHIGTVVKQLQGRVVLDNYRVIKFGLFKGSGDFIGWKEVEVTADMVGKKVAVFLSIETKRPKGRRRPEQENWQEQVQKSGGIAVFVENPEEIDM